MNQELFDKFKNYLEFLGYGTSDMKHLEHEKLMFVFEDEFIDKIWRDFYSCTLSATNMAEFTKQIQYQF